MEDERLAGTQALVGQDDLELIAVGMRDEEVELDRVFVLLFDASPNEEETVGRLPGLGFGSRSPSDFRINELGEGLSSNMTILSEGLGG